MRMKRRSTRTGRSKSRTSTIRTSTTSRYGPACLIETGQITKITFEDETDIAGDAKSVLRKHGKAFLMELLGSFEKEVLETSSNAEKFKQQKADELERQAFMEQ